MPDITISIPADKVARIVAAFKVLFPIPIDLGTGDPMFTDNEWPLECIKRHVRGTVFKYERNVASEQAAQDITYDEDLAS